jgi:site-specific DNA recombinase
LLGSSTAELRTALLEVLRSGGSGASASGAPQKRSQLEQRWTGKPLTKSILRDRVLANPFYYGAFRYRGELHRGSHEPLISLALFEQVQVVLRGKTRPKRFRHQFRYGGLFQCVGCLCAVVGDIKQGRYIYYRCSHRRPPCPEGYIRQEALGEQLRAQIGPVLRLQPEVEQSLREAADELVREGPESQNAQRAALERRLRELEQRLQVLLDLRLAGSVTDSQYLAKQAALTNEQLRVREQLAAFEIPSGDPRLAVDWFVSTCNTLEEVLAEGEDDEVRELLRIVGSNYRWGGGKVGFEPVEPFTIAQQAQNRPNWRAGQNDVRHLVACFRELQGRLSTPPEADATAP